MSGPLFRAFGTLATAALLIACDGEESGVLDATQQPDAKPFEPSDWNGTYTVEWEFVRGNGWSLGPEPCLPFEFIDATSAWMEMTNEPDAANPGCFYFGSGMGEYCQVIIRAAYPGGFSTLNHLSGGGTDGFAKTYGFDARGTAGDDWTAEIEYQQLPPAYENLYCVYKARAHRVAPDAAP